ncbi:MAG: hypothetical protein AAGD34_06480 [Pseudomonadota bacterium]
MTQNKQDRTTAKKPYASPQLNEFGALHRITRGTGGMMTDTGGGMTSGLNMMGMMNNM